MSQADLIDWAIIRLNVKNDAQLSRALGTNPPQISKVRTGVIKVGAALLLKIHDATGERTKELKRIAGMSN